MTVEPRPPPAPLYRWLGGKGRLLPNIMARVPERFGRYFEPFFGAGAVFYELSAQGRITHAVLADGSPVVARALLGLQEDFGRVMVAIDRWAWRGRYDVAGVFGECRTILTSPDDHPAPEVAAALIAHQQLGFNGLWRVNRHGRPNVALGKTAKGEPHQVTVDRGLVLSCHRALQAAAVHHHHAFASDSTRPAWALPEPEPGDLVYLDPPYLAPNAAVGFAGYTPGGFGWVETVDLARWALAQRSRGVHVLVSNSDTPATARAFGLDAPDCPWQVDRFTRSGSVSAGSDRGAVGEVLLW